MWDLIVSVPDHCLSFYFTTNQIARSDRKAGIQDARISWYFYYLSLQKFALCLSDGTYIERVLGTDPTGDRTNNPSHVIKSNTLPHRCKSRFVPQGRSSFVYLYHVAQIYDEFIIFQVTENKSNRGYDSQTGISRTTAQGLYSFSLTLVTYTKGQYINNFCWSKTARKARKCTSA